MADPKSHQISAQNVLQSSLMHDQSNPPSEGSNDPDTAPILSVPPRQTPLLASKTRFNLAASGPSVQTPDTNDVFSDSYPLKQSRQTSLKGDHRAGRISGSTRHQSMDKGKGKAEFDTILEDYDTPKVLSEEYDLAREDPRVMQDVQQVLKLKARRESRKFSGQSPPHKDVTPSYDIASGSSLSSNSSPLHSFPPTILPPQGPSFKVESEVDFSPSTTQAMSAPLHPVPALSLDGKLLDWSSVTSDDDKYEKRWTISISKRKEKERLPVNLMNNTVAQESLYAKKIAKIKGRVGTLTLRKAAITANQLQRRYDILYGSLTPGSTPLNIASIARWNGGLDGLLRTSFEKTEPFTWLKHLDKPGTKPSTRLMWHLNALIVEEYYHSLALQQKAEILDDGHYTDLGLSSRRSPNRVSLWHSLDPSLSKKLSLEGQVSFEPRAESIRELHDGDSRRSIEGFRGQKYWSPKQNDSARNSINSVLSGSSQHVLGISSPANSHRHVRGDSIRNTRLRPANGSDDALSSTRGSLSDPSEIDRVKGARSPKRHSRTVEIDSPVDPSAVNPGIKFVISSDSVVAEGGEVTGTASLISGKARGSEVFSDTEPSVPTRASKRQSIEDEHRVFDRRRRAKTSVHSPDRLPHRLHHSRRPEVEVDSLYREYDLKAQLLDDAMTHNHAIRQLLHRVAAGVREYETIQTSLMKSLGVTYRNMPQDLIDSFRHDPSAVTGATRRFRGWRAIEDIHQRLLQQRDTFQRFISARRRTSTFPHHESVLHDPINSVLQALHALDNHQQEIATKAEEVTDVLAGVKDVHATVKTQYNDTLAHISVVYPELSQIVGLEESYRDLYQQFWELGLDALTFLLDTVTPFWRNYGRIIGLDVQDFLIVPLYRNEFTGEAKRYSIERMPRRSFRHWMGLLLFFILAMAVTLLQGRAAVTSIMHFRLLGVTHSGLRYTLLPFFWTSIIIQWAAVFTELGIVATQVGVVIWWIGWSVKLVD